MEPLTILLGFVLLAIGLGSGDKAPYIAFLFVLGGGYVMYKGFTGGL